MRTALLTLALLALATAGCRSESGPGLRRRRPASNSDMYVDPDGGGAWDDGDRLYPTLEIDDQKPGAWSP